MPAPEPETSSLPYFHTDDEMFDYYFNQAQEHQSPEIKRMLAIMDAMGNEANEMARAEAANEVVYEEPDDDNNNTAEQPEKVIAVAPAVPASVAPGTFRGNRRQRRAQASRAHRAKRR